MSANDSKLQSIEKKVSKFKATDVSSLLERIATLETEVRNLSSQIDNVDQSIADVETNLSEWTEKEFSKVYDILNDNPLGK
jgi:peptidoglycan hydrolase CwlO-like protein